MVFCFDTDVLSWLVRSRPPVSLIRTLAATDWAQQATTAISAAELLLGIERDPSPSRDERVREIIAGMRVVPFDRRAATAYAELRASLERKGKPLDERDLQIAAICLARDLTLVTGNTRHFDRVPELRVENWLEG